MTTRDARYGELSVVSAIAWCYMFGFVYWKTSTPVRPEGYRPEGVGQTGGIR